ncbi:hypothetical protein [Paraburkholderia sp. BL6669N2]|uniref:hypothetical protein n=1 Tax=Paraburkholderia sp. BL6669N2 TaxID=1938807 RepID=UPI000E24C270|nr:hypothetical protein [Paraburkholderia sp. BL6669N2]
MAGQSSTISSEFWVYRQLRKRIDSGELHLNDSIQHRRFSDHLVAADRELRQGKLKHLDYDAQRRTLTWRQPKADKESAKQDSFYAKLPLRDIAPIIRFVNERCGFLSAMTPCNPVTRRRSPTRTA